LAAADVISAALARIAELNAFTVVAAKMALARAAEIDRSEPSGLLAGVPISVKGSHLGARPAGDQWLTFARRLGSPPTTVRRRQAGRSGRERSGSIHIASAFCGSTRHKPTWARLPDGELGAVRS